MIRYDGFYISTKKYLVVDTPVFDEITEGIQILQFFYIENQQGGPVLIAEFGVLEPHPIEINVKELCHKIQSNTHHFSKREQDEILYKIRNPGEFPKWFDMLDAEIFEKRRDSAESPRIYNCKYVIKNAKKFSLHPEKEIGIDFDRADGEIKDEELILVYHYGNKDMLSIFKFVAFY
jgi:hypothetical protein